MGGKTKRAQGDTSNDLGEREVKKKESRLLLEEAWGWCTRHDQLQSSGWMGEGDDTIHRGLPSIWGLHQLVECPVQFPALRR